VEDLAFKIIKTNAHDDRPG